MVQNHKELQSQILKLNYHPNPCFPIFLINIMFVELIHPNMLKPDETLDTSWNNEKYLISNQQKDGKEYRIAQHDRNSWGYQISI